MSLRPRRDPTLDGSTGLLAAAMLLLASCGPAAAPGTPGPEAPPAPAFTTAEPLPPTIGRLPTGASLDPAGMSVNVGSLPLAMEVAPDGRHVLLLLNGWREQGVQVVESATGRVTQTAEQPAAFLGLAFSPDGRSVYASGGNQDVIYRYRWDSARLTLEDSIVLARKRPNRSGTRYPGASPSRATDA